MDGGIRRQRIPQIIFEVKFPGPHHVSDPLAL